jgi:hypothetical protein
VILGGWAFLMSEVTLYLIFLSGALLADGPTVRS